MTDLFFSPSSLSGSFTGAFAGDGSAVAGIVSASHALASDTAISASHALNADTALTSVSASHALNADTALTSVSASYALSASEASHAKLADASTTATSSSYALRTTEANHATASDTATSASYAVTASFATNVPTTASFALQAISASFAETASFLTGLIESASFAVTASFASNVLKQASASHADRADSASFATTASAATSITFIPASASFAQTASFASNVLQAGTGFTVTGTLAVSGNINDTGYAVTASAFKGDGAGITGVVSASFATTASAATSITFVPASASFATTASAATSITFTPATASYALKAGIALSGTGSWTGSVTGNLQGSASYATTASAATSLTFIPASASFATTASFASNVLKQASASHADVADVALSGTGSFTGTFVGNGAGVTGVVSASFAARAISSSNADTASVLLGSIQSASYALTASFAQTALTANTATTASFATTASAATSITFVPSTASFANSALSSSYAVTASFATNATGDPQVVFTSSLTPTQSWQTVSSGSQHLSTGLYAFTLGANDSPSSGTANTLKYSGMLEWFAEATLASDKQEREVLLHVSGKSQGSGSLYVRTFQSASVLLNLQLYSDYVLGSGSYTSDYGWTFRKLL